MDVPIIPAPITATSQAPMILYHLTQGSVLPSKDTPTRKGTVGVAKPLNTVSFRAFFRTAGGTRLAHIPVEEYFPWYRTGH